MSLTFKVQPQELMPVYNPLIIVATSSQQTQLNYQLVSNIYCRGSLVTQMKTPVNPEGYLVVDLHKHLENRISFDFYPEQTGIYTATQSMATYSVTFSDEFRQEWAFIDNYYWPITGDDITGFIGPVSGPRPYYNVNDEIYVSQTSPYTYASYNGVHKVVAVTQSGTQWIVVTDALWQGSSAVSPGTITYANFGLTTLATTYSVTGKYAFNGVENFEDFINWDFEDYRAQSGAKGKFLTNMPNKWELDVKGDLYLNMYQNTTNAIKDLKIRTNLGTYSISSPYFNLSNPQNRLLQCNVSPWYLEQEGWIDSSSFVNGEANVDVWVVNNLASQTIATQSFVITNKCSKYEKMELIFLDKLGSFVSYTFNLVNRNNLDIKRTDYQQHYGSYAPASQDWTYKSYDRGRKTLDIVVTETFTLNSDWLSQSNGDYLFELLQSPEVYLRKNFKNVKSGKTGEIVAINITVNPPERKQVVNEQLINYTLTFELSNKNSTQR